MAQPLLSRSLHPQLYQILCRRSRVVQINTARGSFSGSYFRDTRHWSTSSKPSSSQAGNAPNRSRCVVRRVFSTKSSVAAQGSPESRSSQTASNDRGKGTQEPAKPVLAQTTNAITQKVRERISSLTPRENIYTVPNILTFSRLLATPVIGYLVLHDNHVWAAALFAYAGISDLVDGWIARKYKLQTVVGSVIDPMADKALMTILVGCLAVKGALPLWLATLIFGRDMSLGIAAFYYRYASLPAPKTFMRYWDFSLPSAEVHPTQISKWNTFLQLGLIGCTVVEPALASAGLLSSIDVQTSLQGLQYLVAGTTLWSGASYLWTRDAVVILGEDEALKKKQGFRGRATIGVSFAAFIGLAIYFALREERKETTPVEA